MSELTCADCRARLPDFYARTLSRRLNKQVVEHLRQCDDCLRLAEQQKEKHSLITKTPPHMRKAMSLGNGQAFIKWGGVLFVLMLTVSLACFTYGAAKEEAVQSHVQAWVEMRYPDGKLGPKEMDWRGWLPYYRHEVHYPLLQQELSGENRRLGTVVVSQRAWHRQIDVRLTQPVSPLVLALPGEEGGNSSPTAWEALEQLPASVTVDVVVSTRHFLTPRAMVEMLSRYNTELQQVYVYGGETAEERRQLPPLALVLQSASAGGASLEESGYTLLEKLEAVVQHPVLAEEHGIWERRLAYVDEHGFRTYGALVRGTPQALLQLREVLELREAIIVNIDWLYAS